MTSRSEISASPPSWPLLLPARHFVTVSGTESETDLVPRGTRNVCDVYRSILGKVSLSLSLFYFLLLFLCACLPATWDPFLVILYAKTCVWVRVCVFSKHFRWAGCSSFAWRLSAFAQCTVYALLVHQHVLYGILMLTLQATEPFFVLFLLLLLFLCSTLTFIMLVVLSGT